MYIDAGASIAKIESETDSRPRHAVTSFNASITGDELNSAVQLLNFRSIVKWHDAECMLYII